MAVLWVSEEGLFTQYRITMSLFQSALGFLAGTGSAAASRDQHDFVGQVVELGDTKLRIRRVIAEGEETRSMSCICPCDGGV